VADGNTAECAENVRLASTVFADYGSFIRAIIRSQIGDQAEAEDLYQDLFLALVQKPIPESVVLKLVTKSSSLRQIHQERCEKSYLRAMPVIS